MLVLLVLVLLVLLQVLLVKNVAHVGSDGGHRCGVRQQILAHGKVFVALDPARIRFDAANIALGYERIWPN